MVVSAIAGQKHAALAQANATRFARAALKRDVESGTVTVAEILNQPLPAWLASMRICDLLDAQPRWGAYRVRTFLERFRISEHRAVGSLSDRQRELLARTLAPPVAAPGSGEQDAMTVRGVVAALEHDHRRCRDLAISALDTNDVIGSAEWRGRALGIEQAISMLREVTR